MVNMWLAEGLQVLWCATGLIAGGTIIFGIVCSLIMIIIRFVQHLF